MHSQQLLPRIRFEQHALCNSGHAARCVRLGGRPATALRYQVDKLDPAAMPQQAAKSTGGRTFMLAVDESQDSKYAVEWSLKHMCQAGDQLQLVHVIPLMPRSPASPLPVPGVHPSLVAAATQQQWEQHISNVITQPIEAAGVSWGMQLLQEPVSSPEGPAAKAAVGDLINAAAAAAGATAIIAASASPGGLAEWLRGSVTHHLAHTAAVPVVVLHRPKQPRQGGSRSGSPWWLAATMDAHHSREEAQQQEPAASGPTCGRGRKLLVGVDESPDSAAGLRWVVSQLWRPGDTLALLHVVPVLPATSSYTLAPDGLLYTLPLPPVSEAQAEEDYWRKLLLERCAPMLEAAGVPYELEVVTGYGADPLEGVADAVRGAAARLSADVLVLSGHGKAAWEQWLLGSVTNYCAHHCQQPVVVLHGSRWNM